MPPSEVAAGLALLQGYPLAALAVGAVAVVVLGGVLLYHLRECGGKRKETAEAIEAARAEGRKGRDSIKEELASIHRTLGRLEGKLENLDIPKRLG